MEELPRTIIRRVVKAKLASLQSSAGSDKEIQVQKEALMAFGESAKIFLHYLTATANDVCHDAKRALISADDVLNAVEDLDFPEFLEPLRATLDVLREGNQHKSSKKKEAASGRKRKAEAAAAEAAGHPAGAGAGGDHEGDHGEAKGGAGHREEEDDKSEGEEEES